MELNYWTIKDIAADPRVALTVGTLKTGVITGEYPPLEADGKLGPTKLYTPATAERFIEQLLAWRADSPARAAAKRAAAARAETERMDAIREAEMKRIETNQMLLKGDLAARERFERDKAAWIEEQKKAWGG